MNEIEDTHDSRHIVTVNNKFPPKKKSKAWSLYVITSTRQISLKLLTNKTIGVNANTNVFC